MDMLSWTCSIRTHLPIAKCPHYDLEEAGAGDGGQGELPRHVLVGVQGEQTRVVGEREHVAAGHAGTWTRGT